MNFSLIISLVNQHTGIPAGAPIFKNFLLTKRMLNSSIQSEARRYIFKPKKEMNSKIFFKSMWRGTNIFICSLLLFSMMVQSLPSIFVDGEENKSNRFREDSNQSASVSPEKVSAKENTDKRTANSKTFEENGKGYTEIHSDTINYQDDQGQWHGVNNDLIKSESDGYAYQNAGNRFRVNFKSEMGFNFFKIDQNGYSLSVSLDGAKPILAEVDKNNITYKNVLPNIDLQYSVDNDFVKEDVVLTDKPETRNISYTITTSANVKLLQDKTSNISAVTDKGDIIWQMARPSVVNKTTGDPMFGRYILASTKSNEYSLNLPIIDEFMPNPEIGYPVVIDPTISVIGGTQNAYVLEGGGEEGYTHPTPADIRVGNTEWGEARSFLKFDLSGIPNGATINSSVFGITCNEERASVPRIKVNRVTGRDWNESEISWLNQPAVDSIYESSFVGNTAWSWWNFDITDMTKKWVSGAYPNYGLALVGQDKTVSRRVFLSKYYNSNGLYRPYIKVDYTLDGSTPAKKLTGLQSWSRYVSTSTGDVNLNVNIANGNLVTAFSDLSVDGLGFDTNISHAYNSQENADSRFGYNWTISANKRLIPSADKKTVIYKDETGTEFTFFDTDGNGNYVDNNEFDLSSGFYSRTDHRPNGLNWGLKYDSVNHLFKAISNNKVTYTFDESGKIISEMDRNNNTLSYEYSGNQLTAIRNNNSAKAVMLSYDNNDRLQDIVDYNYQDPDYKRSGQKITYAYDNNDLKTVSKYTGDILVGTTTFNYLNHQLSSVLDAKNNSTTITIAANKVTEIIDALGKKTSISYQSPVNSQTGLTKVVSAKGNEAGANPADFTSSYYFSTNPFFHYGLVTKEVSVPVKTDTNPTPTAQTTEYDYSDDYSLTGVTDPTGTVEANAYDDFSGLLTYQYNKLKVLTLKNTYNYSSYEEGDWKLIDSYNGNGVQTIFGYDARGNLTKKSVIDGDNINLLHNGGFESVTRRADKWDSYCGGRSEWYTHAGDYFCPSGSSYIKTGETITQDFRTRDLDQTTSTDGTNSQSVGFNGETRNGKSSNVFQVVDETTKTTASTTYTLSFQYKLDSNANIGIQMAEDSIDTFGHDNYGTQVSPNTITGPRDGQWHQGTWQFTTRGANADTDPYWTSRVYLRIIAVSPPGAVSGKVWFDSVKLQKGTTVDQQVEKYSSFEYNTQGQVSKEKTPEGKEIIYEWDSAGNLVSTKDPLLNITSFTYDANSNKLSKIEPKGNATSDDPNDFKTIFTYNGQRQITATIDAKTNSKTVYTYDVNGDLETSITPNGLKTTYINDKVGRPSETISPYGYKSKVEYDAHGNPKGISDPNGKNSGASYDAADRVVKETDPDNKDTNYSYDNTDNIKVISTETKTIGYGYDKDGKLLTESQNGITQSTYAYDRVGNLSSDSSAAGATAQSYSLTDEITKVTVAGQNFAYHRNKNNQLTSLDQANGDTISYGYNNGAQVNALTYSRAGSNTRKYNYEYDANGNRIKVTEDDSKITDYSYDNQNQLVATANQNSTNLYTYDNAGNLQTNIKKNGADLENYVTYSYDGNRLIKKIISNRSVTPNIPSWEAGITDQSFMSNMEYYGYDANGNMTSRDNGDWVSLLANLNGNITNARDNFSGTVNKISDNTIITPSYGGAKFQQGLVLDNNSYLSYPSSGNLNKDEGTIEFWVNPTWGNDNKNHTFFDYHPNDDNFMRIKKTADNKLMFEYRKSGQNYSVISKNPENWVSGNWHKVAVNWSQPCRAYIFLNGEKIDEVKSCKGGPVIDKIPLVGISEKIIIGGAQGATGIIESAEATFDEIKISSRALPENRIETSYSSSTEAALTKTTTYSYDSDDYLVKITKPGNIVINYTYDANKRLIKRSVTGQADINYAYDGDKMVAEKDNAGVISAKYIYDAEGALLYIEQGTNKYYPIYDGLGSITMLRDQSGVIVATYEYDDWGKQINKTGTVNTNLQFASYFWDNDAQLYHLGARWYDPTLARFVSVDPRPGDLDDSLSLNEYLYCQNNPINFADPDGDKRVRITFKARVKKVRSAWDKLTDRLVAMGLGDAAVYMSQNSKFWRYAMDHPFITGTGVGIVGGIVFAGGSLASGGAIIFSGYLVYVHTLWRMISRGVSPSAIQNTINNGMKFRYFHEGVWKTGFYNASTRVMVATYNNQINTVMTRVTTSYIKRLMRK